MFFKISHTIIKPGLGLTKECVSHNINCLYFYQRFNEEFELNIKKLKYYKIGKKLNILNIKRLQEGLFDINLFKKSVSTSKIEWSAQKLC